MLEWLGYGSLILMILKLFNNMITYLYDYWFYACFPIIIRYLKFSFSDIHNRTLNKIIFPNIRIISRLLYCIIIREKRSVPLFWSENVRTPYQYLVKLTVPYQRNVLMLFLRRTVYLWQWRTVARERFLDRGGGRKYKIYVSFCQKMANHLHQLVISMEAGLTQSLMNYSKRDPGGRSSQPPEARGSGGGVPALGVFWEFITKIIHF